MAEENDLQRRLERLGRLLVSDLEAWEAKTRDRRRNAVDRVVKKVEEKLDRAMSRQDRRAARLAERAERRERQREAEEARASVPGGIVMLIAAVLCGAMAIVRPELWWLIFVALGLGSGGARQLVVARRRSARELPEEREEQEVVAPAKTHEVDVLCDELLADLSASPQAVRDFIQQPELTIEALRKTCKALDERRRQLDIAGTKTRLAELETTKKDLQRKSDESADADARRRYDDALRSVHGQEEALKQLLRAGDRIDSEYTSLLVQLQELRTRVAVAKTAGSGLALEEGDGSERRVVRRRLVEALLVDARHGAKA